MADKMSQGGMRAIIMDGKSASRLVNKLGIFLPGWGLKREEQLKLLAEIVEVAISYIKDESINSIFRKYFKNFIVSETRLYEYNMNDYIIAVGLLREEVKSLKDLVITVLDPAIEVTNSKVKAKITVSEKPTLLFE